MGLLNELSRLSGNEWNGLFQQAMNEGKREFNSMSKNVTYQFLGELDSSGDCIYAGVPKEIVKRQFKGKCNVFSVSDGTYVFCNDCTAESIFDSGKCQSKFGGSSWCDDGDEDY